MKAIWYFDISVTTRWFKYARDWFVQTYTQISPGHIWATLYLPVDKVQNGRRLYIFQQHAYENLKFYKYQYLLSYSVDKISDRQKFLHKSKSGSSLHSVFSSVYWTSRFLQDVLSAAPLVIKYIFI